MLVCLHLVTNAGEEDARNEEKILVRRYGLALEASYPGLWICVCVHVCVWGVGGGRGQN